MLTITPFSPRRNNSDRRQSWPAKPDILPTVRWSAGAHKGGHLLQHLTSPAHCPSPRGCLSQCQSQSTFLHQNLRQQTEDRRQETGDRSCDGGPRQCGRRRVIGACQCVQCWCGQWTRLPSHVQTWHWTPPHLLPPPQDSHSEVQIYDLRLCYPPHLTRRAIIASNTNTQRSDQVALIWCR